MMRSMFSGVAGLKTHQIKMDVIGNNIANVNTTSFKSDSTNFAELLYQNRSSATAANERTGRAGINANQIGLGVQLAAINSSITTGGAAMTTNNPFDIKINGDAFFIVSPDGTNNYFTRDGSFYIDGSGNLATTSNGYNVMGWGVDEETGTIRKNTVAALRVMSAANMEYPPEATTEAYVDGILDRNEPDAGTEAGKALNLAFYDSLGYSYTAKFSIKNTSNKGEYTVELADIVDSNGKSLTEVYGVGSLSDIVTFGSPGVVESRELYRPISDVTFKKTSDVKDLTTTGYVATAGGVDYVYLKNKVFSEVVEGYDKAFPGLNYTIDDAEGKVIKKGESLTAIGVGTLTKANLVDRGIIQSTNPGEEDTFYIVERKDDGSYEYKQELKDPASGGAIADWKTALGVEGDITELVFDLNNGTADIKVTQKFKVSEDAGIVVNGSKVVGTLVSQREALGVGSDDFETLPDGSAYVTFTRDYSGNLLTFDVNTGLFDRIGGDTTGKTTLNFNARATTTTGETVELEAFSDITVDWSNTSWFNNGGASTTTATAGNEETGMGAGRKVGVMNGLSIQNNGQLYATYDNGMSKLVGQIAVARFANASGLEKIGDNLYSTTPNSGEFNSIGEDITQNGTDSLSTGVLEMSNVDLSNEFTHMITTQRGFQANSRIITVSDTLLEELVNLKR